MHRRIISSTVYNWLKQGTANQPGGHLSAGTEFMGGMYLQHLDRGGHNIVCPPNILW